MAFWNGSLTFGLVSIPVSLRPPQDAEEVEFHLVDDRTMDPIGYKKVNKETGEEVPKDHLAKVYKTADGHTATVSDKDLRDAAPEVTGAIEIFAFVDEGQIDPIFFEKPYYIESGGGKKRLPGMAKGYLILRDALVRSKKIAVARVVLRARQYLAAVVARGPLLTLCLLRWQHEVEAPESLKAPEGDVSQKELQAAEVLIDSMTEEWHPEQYRDEYREKLIEFLEKKAVGQTKEGAKHAQKRSSQQGQDIMKLLQDSVEKGRKKKSG